MPPSSVLRPPAVLRDLLTDKCLRKRLRLSGQRLSGQYLSNRSGLLASASLASASLASAFDPSRERILELIALQCIPASPVPLIPAQRL